MHSKFTATQASQKLNISPYTIKRWIQQGKLNGDKNDGKWYVFNDEVFAQHLHSNDEQIHNSVAQHLHSKIEHLKSLVSEKDKQLADKNVRIEDLREYLTRRDEHIESLTQELGHLTQIVAMSQKNIGALTEQLDDSRQMIEDMRSRSWWKRIFRR